MSAHEIAGYEHIHGQPLGFDPNTGKQLYANMLPPEMVAMNVEIGMHHPELVRLLDEGLRNDAYGLDSYFGIVFAYCGIALDSSESATGYSVAELVEQAGRALVNKRENVAVSINTIPSVQSLVQFAIDSKEAHKEQELIVPPTH